MTVITETKSKGVRLTRLQALIEFGKLSAPAYGKKAYGGQVENCSWLVAAVVLLVVEVYIEVWFSETQGSFMTALEEKNREAFYSSIQAFAVVLFVGGILFAAGDYAVGRTALIWRSQITSTSLSKYLEQNVAVALYNECPEVDNPSQRIVEGINICTNGYVSLFASISGKVMQVFAFVGVLYQIAPQLAWMAVMYSVVATAVSTYLFWDRLSQNRSKIAESEASLRVLLTNVFTNKEEIAFYGGGRYGFELKSAAATYRNIEKNSQEYIRWNGFVGTFNNYFNYLTILLPYIVCADGYFSGALTLGEVSRVATAFSQIRSGFGLLVSHMKQMIINQTHLERLLELMDAIESVPNNLKTSRIQLTEVPPSPTTPLEVRINNLSVHHPGVEGGIVFENLSLVLKYGSRLMVTGQNGCGKTSLFRALSGMWDDGTGSIATPPAHRMHFVPLRSYLPPNTGLRGQLCYPRSSECSTKDAELVSALHKVGLAGLPARVGGWDNQSLDLSTVLSPGERQRLAFARLILTRPAVALLDEATCAVNCDSEAELYSLLDDVPIVISIAHRDSLRKYHNQFLEFCDNGNFKITKN
eukprot:TRINITY_DN12620_c0_g1_i1.p1 TRINITY_DN12620_c0_g1~~TRINITY_DN12620_c0_g1_i1.p1  ORF type:complete len:586 (+),score=96.61 TRINITY_DN12620_c0_g1_i1:59-1816(+)